MKEEEKERTAMTRRSLLINAGKCAVGIAVIARCLQIPAQDCLKREVAEAGDKTDGRKNDAGFQQFVHARWLYGFLSAQCQAMPRRNEI